jgi:hypothetical protein
LKKTFYIFTFLLLAGFWASAQENGHLAKFPATVKDGDTIIYIHVNDIWVYPERKFKNKRQQQNYSRYVAKVKKVYPLAVEARILLDAYEPVYYSLDSDKERKRMMKNLEKQLLDKHKEELKKWSISDGKMLLKLINRETHRTPYSIIQNFRGDFSAVFWQGIARLFKNNLKDGYDPTGDDKMLEEVVRKIESGYY